MFYFDLREQGSDFSAFLLWTVILSRRDRFNILMILIKTLIDGLEVYQLLVMVTKFLYSVLMPVKNKRFSLPISVPKQNTKTC